MSFTSTEVANKKLNLTETIQVELLDSETTLLEDVPCRLRTCTYVNGVKAGCSSWTYGECDKGDKGELLPITPN